MKTRKFGQNEQKQEIAGYPTDPVARKSAINQSYCRRNKEALAEKHRIYYQRVKERDREIYNQRNREQYEKLRQAALTRIGSSYGVRCRCCGEDREVFLAIDHVNGGGHQYRRSFKSQHGYYKYLSTEAPLEEFQILCHNCNYAKREGHCPHLDEIKVEIV